MIPAHSFLQTLELNMHSMPPEVLVEFLVNSLPQVAKEVEDDPDFCELSHRVQVAEKKLREIHSLLL